MSKVEIGSVVVFNNLPNAARFEVVERLDNFRVSVREENTDYRSQVVDESMIAKVVVGK